MAQRDHQKDSTGRTVAIVGGGAFLAWLLLRGSGWKLGNGDSGPSSGATGAAPAPTTAALPPCRVRIDANGIELDGARADLVATVERCRAAGAADLAMTGAAIVGVLTATLRALQDAGVVVRAAPEVWDVAGMRAPGAP